MHTTLYPEPTPTGSRDGSAADTDNRKGNTSSFGDTAEGLSWAMHHPCTITCNANTSPMQTTATPFATPADHACLNPEPEP